METDPNNMSHQTLEIVLIIFDLTKLDLNNWSDEPYLFSYLKIKTLTVPYRLNA